MQDALDALKDPDHGGDPRLYHLTLEYHWCPWETAAERYVFAQGFAEFAPEGYDLDADLRSRPYKGYPLCLPWLHGDKDAWYEPSLDVRKMGRRYATLIKDKILKRMEDLKG